MDESIPTASRHLVVSFLKISMHSAFASSFVRLSTFTKEVLSMFQIMFDGINYFIKAAFIMADELKPRPDAVIEEGSAP